MAPEPDNQVVRRLADVVVYLLQGDSRAARDQLEPLIGVTCKTDPIMKMPVRGPITWPTGTGALTHSPPRATIATVYVRDQFTCRYCGRWTLPTQILRLISAAFPDEFPFRPKWRRDIAPRAYWDISTSVDHIHAVALGGDFADPANLATACARCQYQKSSRALETLGWRLQAPVQPAQWDGLMSHYSALWEAVGRPDKRHHSSWVHAFSVALGAACA